MHAIGRTKAKADKEAYRTSCNRLLGNRLDGKWCSREIDFRDKALVTRPAISGKAMSDNAAPINARLAF
jgi:hypothetical protein